MVTPEARQQIAKFIIQHYSLSERRVCRLLQISRTGFRYIAKPKSDDQLRNRLKELATRYSRYGYLLLHGMLRAEGLVENKKRTYRLYTEENLQVRTKKRNKLTRPRLVMTEPRAANERWSMDFVSDQLFNGRRYRVLNILDDCTKELVGQYVDISISGQQVARYLSQIGTSRALPNSIVCDNGTEFTSKAMFFWSQDSNVRLDFIQPGKPTQNAFVESFNGKLRDACLNQHWFRSIDEAREVIKKWRYHYNNERPHSSLGYVPPAIYAKKVA